MTIPSSEMSPTVAELSARIAALESELAGLRAQLQSAAIPTEYVTLAGLAGVWDGTLDPLEDIPLADLDEDAEAFLPQS